MFIQKKLIITIKTTKNTTIVIINDKIIMTIIERIAVKADERTTRKQIVKADERTTGKQIGKTVVKIIGRPARKTIEKIIGRPVGKTVV